MLLPFNIVVGADIMLAVITLRTIHAASAVIAFHILGAACAFHAEMLRELIGFYTVSVIAGVQLGDQCAALYAYFTCAAELGAFSVNALLAYLAYPSVSLAAVYTVFSALLALMIIVVAVAQVARGTMVAFILDTILAQMAVVAYKQIVAAGAALLTMPVSRKDSVILVACPANLAVLAPFFSQILGDIIKRSYGHYVVAGDAVLDIIPAVFAKRFQTGQSQLMMTRQMDAGFSGFQTALAAYAAVIVLKMTIRA